MLSFPITPKNELTIDMELQQAVCVVRLSKLNTKGRRSPLMTEEE